MLAERVVEWTKQWKEAGLREGRREGRREGQVHEAQSMVLEVLRARFKQIPDDITAIVRHLEARSTLRALLRQAAPCATLEAFRDVLQRRTG